MNATRSTRMPGAGITVALVAFFSLSLAACATLESYLPSFGSSSSSLQTRHRLPPPTRKASAVITTARKALGRPYRWGGKSLSQGFDCSGLVWWAYRSNGVSVPRVSWEQYGAGRFVEKSDIRPGDMVFYRVQTGKSLHVGIVTDRGTFIHSPRSGKRVRESDMFNPFWVEHYVGTRRVL